VDSIRFVVPGRPVPKARARVPKNGHAFTPTRTRDYEKKVALCALAKRGGKDHMIEGPVALVLFIREDRVEVWVEPDTAGEAKIMKWDADNVLKACLDGLQGVLFKNDRQVTRIEVYQRGDTV
jgi:Holliday junction resolvase RusA-like endonuclease